MNNTLLYILIGILIGSFLSFNRIKAYREVRKKKPKRPFPYQWRRILVEKVEFYNRLSSSQKSEFEDRVHIFLLNVNVIGVETEVTHLDKILVAAGAIIPIFGFKSWHYANLDEVQIYPDKFPIPQTTNMANGLIGWGAMEGKMMLSRKALHHGFYDQTDHKNVAIHEFVHILDKQDGQMDGMLGKVMNEIDIMPWLQIINQKISEIDIGDSSIRDYGASNEAEFLAVVSEFFFEAPDRLKTEHPALYSALDSFYNRRSSTLKARNQFTKR